MYSRRPAARSRVGRRLVTATGALASWLCGAGTIAAQEAACTEGRIAEIVIDNNSVFDLSDPGLEGRFSWAYRIANGLHFRTRPEVIERELLFEVGDCYDVELLRDSERLIRGFGFIARVDIHEVRQADDRVQVVVDTQDEWSTKVDIGVGADEGRPRFEGARLVEDNLLGTGRRAGLFFDQSEYERIYGMEYVAPQLFSTRSDLALQVARTEVGYSVHQSVAYPFVGEDGRVAWRQKVERRDRYFELFMPDDTDRLARIWMPTRREQVELAGAFRWGGRRYRHALIGGALVGERINYPGLPIFADSAERPVVPSDVLRPEWQPISTARAMLLLGGRSVEFVRRQAVETVNGVEDLQLGMEGEISIGPTIPFASKEHDLALAGGFSVAMEPRPEIALGGQIAVDGRRNLSAAADTPAWGDVTAEVDGWAYLRGRRDSPNTVVASVSAVGGWNPSSPFQLTLGGDAGLRGFPRHLDPGGRRIVTSIEHRRFFGWPFRDLLDLGGVVFVDAGKIWPGDVPFGVESPVRAAAGIGIRAAFPPGSRQTFRADFGIPIFGHEGVRGFVVSVGTGQVIGRRQVTRRDPQIVRSARYALTSSRFLYSGWW